MAFTRLDELDSSAAQDSLAAQAVRDGERLYVRFSLRPKKNEAKSLAAGRPVFEEVEYVEIIVPGDKQNIPHRAVTEQDKQRFAKQYAAWKAGISEPIVGTPLSEWAGCTRAQVEELAYANVKSVEHLAGLSDGAVQNLGFGTLSLREKAKAWLEQAKGSAPSEQLRAALAERDNVIAVLQRQMNELLEAKAKADGKAFEPAPLPTAVMTVAEVETKKRGRPKKTVEPTV